MRLSMAALGILLCTLVIGSPLHARYELQPAVTQVQPWVCPWREKDGACPEYAMPRGDPANWVTRDDYPVKAARANQSGAVIVRLEIDRSINRPSSCNVLQSSNFEVLDVETCKILVRRGRFLPTTPNSKSLTANQYIVRVVWGVPWVEFAPMERPVIVE